LPFILFMVGVVIVFLHNKKSKKILKDI